MWNRIPMEIELEADRRTLCAILSSVGMEVRIDRETSQRLDDYCSTHNLSRAEAIRQGIHLLLSK